MPISVTNPFAVIEEIASKSASVGELFAFYYYVGSFSASSSFPIFVAPFALQVKQCVIYLWSTSVTADDVDYWRFAPRRMRAAASAEIASKSTQLTGGEGIAMRTAWNFDAAVFSPTNGLISKDDAVDLAVFKTGVPPNLTGIACTVRYEPV
jgi:hypothetical protein